MDVWPGCRIHPPCRSREQGSPRPFPALPNATANQHSSLAEYGSNAPSIPVNEISCLLQSSFIPRDEICVRQCEELRPFPHVDRSVRSTLFRRLNNDRETRL